MTARKHARYFLILLAAISLAACMFTLCYNLDNKYTENAPRAVNGRLLLDEEALDRAPVFHLVWGWEFYRDALLSPEDFWPGQSLPHEVIFIGQYPGFEAGDPSRSPHGSATYRLRIAVPAEPRSYTLELPEIYSAYRLYVNGELLAEMGNPDPGHYRPLTGNSTVTFRAQDSIELILAVTDYSGFYSGLTYPPAFGEPRAVSGLLTARFAVRLAACVLALGLGLFYLITGILSRRGPGILYGLMCFFFVGSVCYPVTKTLLATGPAWYGFESFCYCAMLFCVLLIGGRITGAPEKALKAAAAIGLFVCAAVLAAPFFVIGNLPLMTAYSSMMNLYSWALAAFLTVRAARGVYRGRIDGEIILWGVAVFDCALVMDRLLPLYEPILSGWFTEIAGAALMGCFGAALARDTVRQAREKLVLEGRIDSVSRLVELHRSYYPVVLEGIQDARAARHDLRHHMRLIRELAAEENLSALTHYLKEYRADTEGERTLSYTRNYVADTLLRHFAALAAAGNIRFEVRVDMPEHPVVPDAALAIVLGNLLENALEGCAALPEDKRFITVSIRLWNRELCVIVRNSFDGTLAASDGRMLSRKRSGREGMGTSSVKAAAERLHGSAAFTAEDGVFKAEVILRTIPEEAETTI